MSYGDIEREEQVSAKEEKKIGDGVGEGTEDVSE